jgi:hypothetical protein
MIITSVRSRVIQTSIHPRYNGQLEEANIALLFLDYEFLYTKFPTLPLNRDPVIFNCKLYGWGEKNSNPRRDAVKIDFPNICGSGFSEILCTVFQSTANETCNASLGSPLICGDNATFTGFLINNQQCAVTSGGKVVLTYQSIASYRNFIDVALRTALNLESSTRYVVDVVNFDIDRQKYPKRVSVGTAITLRHVLTTAESVTKVAAGVNAIGVQSEFKGEGWVFGKFEMMMNIVVSIIERFVDFDVTVNAHPKYDYKNPRFFNLAVLKVSCT